MTLILASASPYRKSLLEKLGLPFRVIASNIDETPLADEDIESLVSRLALGKAETVARLHPGSLVIGSDQACSLNGDILGKPGNHEKAVNQLRSCSGQWLRFHTALVLFDSDSDDYESTVEAFDVQFRDLEDNEIEHYLRQDKPYDCAGSFRIELTGIRLFRELYGRDFHSLVGLPLIALSDMLIRRGLNPLLESETPPNG